MAFTRRPLAGRMVNPIGFGCMSLSWAYGTPPSDLEGERLLERALELGYDYLDTARIYGDGHNEALIGRALAGRRDEFLLASKAGIIVDGAKRRIDCSPQSIRQAVDTSLSLLRTERIDLYYLHRRDFKVPIEDSVGALADLIAAGKIGAIGLSEMSGETIRKAHAAHPIAAVQNEFSAMTRNPELGALAACAELGIAFVAFSPVGRGLLADPGLDIAALADKDIRHGMPRFQPDNFPANAALARAFGAIAAEEGVTPAQLSLSWVLAQGEHVIAIPGTTSEAHLAENIARWDWQLSDAARARIDATVNQATVAGRRYGAALRPTIDTEDYAEA